MDQTKWPLLDEALHEYASELPPGDQANLLAYTSSLHRAWRSILQLLNVASDLTVLDVGSGFGLLAFELCAQAPMRVIGLDIDPALVRHADRLRHRLSDTGFFHEKSELSYCVGDLMDLPLEDASVDFAITREVFQFLPDPQAAMDELVRVTRPGGLVCVSDMDDQLYLTYPAPSAAFTRLHAALVELQVERGGDRHIGRKLSSLLRTSGCSIASVVVVPEAQHLLVDFDSFERELVLAQFAAARPRVLDAGITTAARFDADLEAVRAEPPTEQFRTNSRIVVIGVKSAD